MSWSDDIRCLYCDGRLPLYRKITNGQFCSSAHRKAYWQEQERLAVERLHQTHDSLRAYRPVTGVESILGRGVPAEIAEVVTPPVLMPVVTPVAAAVPEAERPWWLLLVNTGKIPESGFVVDPVPSQPRWPADGLAGGDPKPLDCAGNLRRPLATYEMYDCGFAPAKAVGIELAAAAESTVAPVTGELAPLAVGVDLALDPVCRLVFEITPDVFDFAPEPEPENLPPFANLLALPQIAARETVYSDSREISAVEVPLRAQLPLNAAVKQTAGLPAAGLRQLPMDHAPLESTPPADRLHSVDLRATLEAPLFNLSTPPARPRLRLAAGRRYAVETRPDAAPAMGNDTSALAAKTVVSLPRRDVAAIPAAAAAMPEPDPAGMVSLAGIPQPSAASIEMRPAPAALSLPQPPRTEPMRPSLKLEPINVKPEWDLSEPATPSMVPPPLPGLPVDQPAEPTGHERANVWMHAVDFWNRAPRDLKMLAVAIPILIGLALHPSLPKVRVTSPANTSGLKKNFQRAMNEQFVNVRQSVLERAAVALDEDFRSGLDDWASPGDASTDWTFDATGFVRPGPLAMYKPTMGLTDYQLQFLGMIDKKALSWVVRAADFHNYYVMKLVVLKAGPLPTIGLTRYAVINGKADSRVDTTVPLDARADMLYRVRLDVQGNDFSLSVQGQMIDAWSEPRLARGGVGFFSARGEESRLRWVQVTHQYDMLGRLCAYLAPYNFTSSSNGITSTTGSWQP